MLLLPRGLRFPARPVERALGVVAVLAALNLGGCATQRVLQQDTVAANLTVSDIYFQQVLNNVARFEANSASMPSFSVVSAGTVNIQDSSGATISPTYSPTLTSAMQGGGAFPILSILFGFNAQRSVTENWSTAPVTDSDNLRRLRCAFQMLVGREASACDRCEERLKGFFAASTETEECMVPRGWYQVGQKCDLPTSACYSAHYCDTYVWVTSTGIDGLTRFTITVLDIATGEIHAPQRTVVRKYKGHESPENLESTEVTATETDKDALKNAKFFELDRERPTSGGENRGLFFVPR